MKLHEVADQDKQEEGPQEPQVRTFSVREDLMDEVNSRLDKLNKRGQTLGAAPVQLVVTGEEFRSREDDEARALARAGHPTPKIRYVQFHFEGDAPKLAGWKFLGTLDHNSMPGKVIVKTVPGEKIPEQFYHSEPICDHCGKIRRRTETFVVQHEGGDMKQIGRNCIRDFLGHDPTRVVGWLEYFTSLQDELDEDEEARGWGGGRVRPLYSTADILSLGAAVIRVTGWVPRSAAGENRAATSDNVNYLLSPPRDPRAFAEWQEVAKRYEPTDKDKQTATAAMEWVKQQPANNEYMHNLHNIVDSPQIARNLTGFAVSAVAAYLKAQEQLVLQKQEKKVSEWIAQPGQKITANVTLQSAKVMQGYYGTTTMLRFVDDQGRTIVWFATGTREEYEQGKKYQIQGTVKKNDEYNGWKQTMLTRVKNLGEIK